MIEHRTLDGDKLCPHPGMTDEDLEEFEHWAKEIETRGWVATFIQWLFGPIQWRK